MTRHSNEERFLRQVRHEVRSLMARHIFVAQKVGKDARQEACDQCRVELVQGPGTGGDFGDGSGQHIATPPKIWKNAAELKRGRF